MDKKLNEAEKQNPWFTRENTLYALGEITRILVREKLEDWLSRYPSGEGTHKKKTIGVVPAGNVPLVGFHDFLCILMSGHLYLAKLSSKDDILPGLIVRWLTELEPGFDKFIHITKDHLKDMDAVIATGSTNTARYFEYYFGKYPHIIRKNRNGVAVLNGKESPRELEALSNDIFRYFGLGCRNVTRLYLPENYNFDDFYPRMLGWKHLIDHHKYANNYSYYKAIYLLEKIPFLDNGFLMVRQDQAISSPISVLYYDFYHNFDTLDRELNEQEEQIQCIVSIDPSVPGAIPPGKSQQPEPWDYADNIDTMEFLLKLD